MKSDSVRSLKGGLAVGVQRLEARRKAVKVTAEMGHGTWPRKNVRKRENKNGEGE